MAKPINLHSNTLCRHLNTKQNHIAHLRGKIGAAPLMNQFGRVPLPQFQIQNGCGTHGQHTNDTIQFMQPTAPATGGSSLTPERHEAGERNGEVVVEQVADARIDARVGQVPVVAVLVALRTHDDRFARIADVRAEAVRVQRPQAEQEADDANDGGGYQHVRVEAEPGKVQGDLDAKVLFDDVERLVSGDKYRNWSEIRRFRFHNK